MNKEKFTKGEWKVTHFSNGQMRVFRAGRNYKEPDIAGTYGANDVANAHLIAAAPEMYEMLQEMIEQYDRDGCTEYEYKLISSAKQLLAKSRGEI